MRLHLSSYTIGLFLMLTLAGCSGSSTPGPQTWLDQPLDGATLSMAKQVVMAHASSPHGVKDIEFVADNVFLGGVSGGGQQFVEAQVEWLPSAPGKYAIRAKAEDSKGGIGPEAVAYVIVEGLFMPTPSAPAGPAPTVWPTPLPLIQATATLAPTPQPLVAPTHTPYPTPQPWVAPTHTPYPTPSWTLMRPYPTPTPTPVPMAADIRLWADQDTVQAGSCTTVRWHVSGVRAYWVDGDAGAGDDGAKPICPCDDETHTLRAAKTDGSEQSLSVNISVQGRCAAPPPPPAGDREGPSIEAWLEPQGTSDSGCRAFVRAEVSDASGVGWVRFHYALDGDGWNTFDLPPLGGDDYGMTIPGASGGAGIEYRVEAGDRAGNISQTGTQRESLPICGPG